MSLTLSGAITGATVSGLTSPTYTPTSITSPNNNSKSWSITALGGTQTGVDVHSASKPFTHTIFGPTSIRGLGTPNPVTGVIKSFPTNNYRLNTRKGVAPAASQPNQLCRISTVWEVPAGADSYDSANIKAAHSSHVGVLWGNSSSLCDTLLSGNI